MIKIIKIGRFEVNHVFFILFVNSRVTLQLNGFRVGVSDAVKIGVRVGVRIGVGTRVGVGIGVRVAARVAVGVAVRFGVKVEVDDSSAVV